MTEIEAFHLILAKLAAAPLLSENPALPAISDGGWIGGVDFATAADAEQASTFGMAIGQLARTVARHGGGIVQVWHYIRDGGPVYSISVELAPPGEKAPSTAADMTRFFEEAQTEVVPLATPPQRQPDPTGITFRVTFPDQDHATISVQRTLPRPKVFQPTGEDRGDKPPQPALVQIEALLPEALLDILFPRMRP